MLLKKYNAEPTPSRFHLDKANVVRYLDGPWGSGKTTACIMEILMNAMEQQPDENNVRRTRWAIIRNTYPELKTTTIKSWEEWVPKEVAPVVYSAPINCRFKQKLADGTVMDLEVFFLALDSPEDVAKLLSMELTGAYLNEAREIPWEIMEGVSGRIDRFPKTEKDENGKTIYGPTRACIIIDSNPPRTNHWLYEKLWVGEPPKGWVKYSQPPAVYKDEATDTWVVNPEAENLSHLSDNYYVNQMQLGEEHIRVNLAGEPGMSRKGKPVFSKFTHHKHVAKQILLPKRGTSVLIGIDFGLTPGCVIGQLGFRGLAITDELPATDESLEDFLDDHVLPLLRDKYRGFTVVASGDPAGGGRSSINKMTSLQVMNGRGIKTYPAMTNNFTKRKEAVDFFLGRDEGLVVSPHCVHLIEALSAGYVYKEVRNSQGKYLEKADKNEFSHIADALQYMALYARYGAGSLGKVQTGIAPASGGSSGQRFKYA